MKKVIDILIYILCCCFVISITFNVIDYMGLTAIYEGNTTAYILFFIIAIILSAFIGPRLYQVIRYFEEWYKNQVPHN